MKATGAYDIAVLRADEYPTWTGEAAFLNAASFGPMPERWRVSIEWFNQAHTDAFSASDYDVHESLRLSRAALAQLIGAEPAHIALTPNTNVGMNLGADLALQRARAHPRGPRVIVLSDDWVDTRDDVCITSSLEPEHRSGIICVRTPDPAHGHDALTRAGIVCAVREGSIRLSPHFYNTIEDMERVVAVLDEGVGV